MSSSKTSPYSYQFLLILICKFVIIQLHLYPKKIFFFYIRKKIFRNRKRWWMLVENNQRVLDFYFVLKLWYVSWSLHLGITNMTLRRVDKWIIFHKTGDVFVETKLSHENQLAKPLSLLLSHPLTLLAFLKPLTPLAFKVWLQFRPKTKQNKTKNTSQVMFTLSWIAKQTTASKFIAHSVINQTYLTMCCVNHRHEGVVIFF